MVLMHSFKNTLLGLICWNFINLCIHTHDKKQFTFWAAFV